MIALSWSRISTYRQCPLKFKLEYLDKAPNFAFDGDQNPYFIRGKNVHAALEKYVIDKLSGVATKKSSLSEVEDTKPFIDRFLAAYDTIKPESQIAMNSNWQEVSWFAKDAYMRAIFDLIALRKGDGQIVDYKTGKYRHYEGDAKSPGQLHLSAAIALTLYPEVDTIRTVYAFVDHKKTIVQTFTQDDRELLVTHFKNEHILINEDTTFKPKVNQYCKYCPATKEQCPYSKKE